MPLVGAGAVERGAVLRGAGGADALEEVGGGAEGVAVVVEQGVLGREAAGVLVELLDAVGGGEEGLEQGGLAVLVEVGGGVGDGGGEVVAEAGVVDLAAAARGGDDDAVLGRRAG